MQISPEAIELVQQAHAGKLSDDKLAKALLAAMTGRVVLVDDRVLAKGEAGQEYEFVLDDSGMCPCPYGKLGMPCVHEIATELIVAQRSLDIHFYAERVKPMRFTPRVQERSPRKHVDYAGQPAAAIVSPSSMGAPETTPWEEAALAELFND